MSTRTNHPITLSFEPVRIGDPSSWTGLSQKAGIYILGVMDPKQTDVFCPLYVGKILSSKGLGLGSNIVDHYIIGRNGWADRHSIFDIVNKGMASVYSDIQLMNQIGNRDHHRLFHAVKNTNDTLLWFNDPNFLTQYFISLYSTKAKNNNKENHKWYFAPGGVQSQITQNIGKLNIPNLKKAIMDHGKQLTDNMKHRIDHFAFTYAEVGDADIASAYPPPCSSRKKLSEEETATKKELEKMNIFTYSAAGTNFNPNINIDLNNVGRLVP